MIFDALTNALYDDSGAFIKAASYSYWSMEVPML